MPVHIDMNTITTQTNRSAHGFARILALFMALAMMVLIVVPEIDVYGTTQNGVYLNFGTYSPVTIDGNTYDNEIGSVIITCNSKTVTVTFPNRSGTDQRPSGLWIAFEESDRANGTSFTDTTSFKNDIQNKIADEDGPSSVEELKQAVDNVLSNYIADLNKLLDGPSLWSSNDYQIDYDYDDADDSEAQEISETLGSDSVIGKPKDGEEDQPATQNSDTYKKLQDYWRGVGSSDAIGNFWSFHTIAMVAGNYRIGSQDESIFSDTGDSTQTTLQQDFSANNAAGTAGVLLGKGDSSGTNSTSTQSYVALKNLKTTTGSTNALYDYSQYGNLLAQVHLDQTTGGIVLASLNGIVRFIAGELVMLAYQSTTLVSTVLDAVISFIEYLNPFAFFTRSLSNSETNITTSWNMGLSVLDDNTLGGRNSNGSIGSTSLGEALNNLYAALYNIGWLIVIPFTFVILIAGLLLFRASRGNAWGKIRKYVTRVALILLGVPVMAWLYTETLVLMKDAITGNVQAADEIVMSTFVDFESWAQNLKLAVPNGAKLEITTKDNQDSAVAAPTNSTIENLQTTTYQINAASWASGYDASKSPSSHEATDEHIDNATISNSDLTAAFSESTNESDRVVSMLQRYIDANTYSASSFETAQQAKLKKSLSNKDTEDDSSAVNRARLIMFIELTSEDCWGWSNSELTGREDMLTDMTYWNAGKPMNILADAGLSASESGNTIRYTDTTGVAPSSAASGQSSLIGHGLSTMSMFNYLNTKFDTTSMTMYNSDKTSSKLVLQEHTSVNLIGQSGLYQVIYWLNVIVVLLAITVMGLFFAFGLLIDVIRNSIKEIINIPMSVMGSLRAGARMITTVVIMIIQIIGTVFLYEIATELIVWFNTNFVHTVAEAVSSLSEGDLGAFAHVILLLLSTILTVMLAVAFVRYRKSILAILEEWSEDFLNRLILGREGAGVPSQAAAEQNADQQKQAAKAQEKNNGNSLSSKAISGLATGVGMGKAVQLFGGQRTKSKGSDEDEAANEGEIPSKAQSQDAHQKADELEEKYEKAKKAHEEDPNNSPYSEKDLENLQHDAQNARAEAENIDKAIENANALTVNGTQKDIDTAQDLEDNDKLNNEDFSENNDADNDAKNPGANEDQNEHEAAENEKDHEQQEEQRNPAGDEQRKQASQEAEKDAKLDQQDLKDIAADDTKNASVRESAQKHLDEINDKQQNLDKAQSEFESAEQQYQDALKDNSMNEEDRQMLKDNRDAAADSVDTATIQLQDAHDSARSDLGDHMDAKEEVREANSSVLSDKQLDQMESEAKGQILKPTKKK